MGTNNIETAVSTTVIPPEHHNSIKTALAGDIIPRNTSGIPTASAGDLGTATYPFSAATFTGRIIHTGSEDRRNFIPSSIMVSYAGATAPTGWLLAKGETIGNLTSGATYAAEDLETLFDIVKLNYGNAGTEVFANGDTVNLPDPRGYIIRTLDQGAGIDSGRAIGTTQADQNQSHNHGGGSHSHQQQSVLASDTNIYRTPSPSYYLAGAGPDTPPNPRDVAGYTLGGTFGNHQPISTVSSGATIATDGGTEVRVKTFALPMIIKI